MPGLAGKLESVVVSSLWSELLSQNHGTLAVGSLFKSQDTVIVLGQDDGVIRSYKIPANVKEQLKTQDVFETKGGSIQNICLHDVARFKSTDIVCTDNHGTLTIFCNGQILMRKCISTHCLSCLTIGDDPLGNIRIVCSDTDGHVYFIKPYGSSERVRLADVAPHTDSANSLSVLSLFAVNLCDSSGNVSSYVLVGDSCRRLHVFQQGALVLCLQTPANITAMCGGHFMFDSARDQVQDVNGAFQQVALGGETGAIYILQDFEIFSTEYWSRGSTLTSLSTVRAPNPECEDLIVCAGHFNGFYVLHRGKEMASYQTDDWVSTVTVSGSHDDPLVVIGCLNGKVHGLQLTFS